MEISQKINSAIVDLALAGALKIFQLNALSRIMPLWHDFHVELESHGEIYFGRGSDKDRDIALLKAVSEAVERAALKVNNLRSSNGIACHHSLPFARSNAYHELLERHIFFCHFLLGIPFCPESEKIEFINTISMSKCFGRCTISQYSTQLNFLQGHFSMTVLSGLEDEVQWGMIMATAFAPDHGEARVKSFLEATRSFLHFRDNPKVSYISNYENSSIVRFEDHAINALNPNYYRDFKTIFLDHKMESSISIEVDAETLLGPVAFQLLIPPELSLESLNVIVARSEFAQGLFTGAASGTKLNFPAIKRFANLFSMEFNGDVNSTYHPYK